MRYILIYIFQLHLHLGPIFLLEKVKAINSKKVFSFAKFLPQKSEML